MDEKKIIASQEEINLIENNAIDKIPINPTAQGFSGFELRKRLAQSVTGKRGSVLALLIEKLKLINDGIEGANFKNIIIDEKKVIIIYADGNRYELDIEPITSQYIKEVNKLKPDENGKVTLNIKDIPNLLETLTDLQNKVNVLETDNTLIKERLDDVEIKDTQQDDKINDLENDKVDKKTTIIGLDLQDNILIGEFRTALGNATQSVAGLLSAEDKTHLDGLVALLETSDDNNVVDTIGEILAIFQNYPEGADLVTILQGKVDKVAGKGLSANDFTDNDKNKLDGIEAGAEVNEVNSVNGEQGDVVLTQDDIGDGETYKRVTQAEKNTWDDKQDKLVAGNNITIDPDTNVVSASGGGEVDLNSTAYYDYAGSIYGVKYDLLPSAWEHSLTVNPSEIGKSQYPNGETEGVIIPQGTASINNRVFYGWTANNQPLVISNSVTSIGNSAFMDWTSNNQPLVIPNSVTSIGYSTFRNWSANNHPLIIPNSVTSIDNNTFQNWASNNQPLVIPDSVTSIGGGAFYGWTSNNHPLIIPNSVTSIGDRVFYGWTSNNQPLVIPNSVTSIGNSLFREWTSNNHPLIIPNSVTSIGNYAFYGWELVPYVEIKSITPPTLSKSNAFDGQNDAPIYVPDESVAAYKAATNWVDLADRIFPVSDKDKAIEDAHNIRFNGSGTNYLTDKTEVESAVKELDTRVNDNKVDIQKQDAKINNLGNDKVDKTTTIIGLDLQDNILIGEFRTALGNATQSVAGLLSAEDKTHLDGLVALLETSDDNNVVDTIGEILAIFQNYPEGADLVTILQGKVDKVAGKCLSSNDFTNNDKNKLDGIEAGAEVNEVNSVNGKQGVVVLNQDNISDGETYKRVTYAEKSTWDGKQDKLVAGENITIDEDTNVISAISASGGGANFHRVRIFNEQDQLITTQILHEEGQVEKIDKPGYLFEFGTRNLFDYNTIITEDIDLTYSVIPPRYVQTTASDFDIFGGYLGTDEYIILPADKPSGYEIVNINVKGVATNGDYLTSTRNMFSYNESLYLELDYLNTSNVTDMTQMFAGSQATTLDLSSFDTSNVINMGSMFNGYQATELDLSSFDTSNVINMGNMFAGSQATTLDLSSFDTSNVINMRSMFYGSQATTLDLSSFDTSNVTSMFSMFNGSQATTIDLSSFDTSNVTSMELMFQSSLATTLDLSSFDTSNVTSMDFMFAGSQVTTLDLSNFDTSNVTNMDDMFMGAITTVGYARTQEDADKFNSSSNKPSTLNFVVKEDMTSLIGRVDDLEVTLGNIDDILDNILGV